MFIIELNDCVWIWLRKLIFSIFAIDGNWLDGKGCKSNISVGGENFCGKIIFLKDNGKEFMVVIHLSEITFMKYNGCKISNSGTMNYVEKFI